MGAIRTGAPWLLALCLGVTGPSCAISPGDDQRDASRAEQVTTPAVDPMVAGDEVSELDGEPLEVAAEDGEAEAAPDLETLAACNGSPASFKVSAGSAVGGPVVGFGAQFNSYLFYPPIGRFDQKKLGQVASLVRELRPQHVRIFFDSRAFRDAANMSSFSRTVALAQSTGASINVTYWHGPYSGARFSPEFGKVEMEKFAEVLRAEIVDAGHTAIKYVTVQNEPNRTKFNVHKQDLVTVYKHLDAALKAKGVRSRVGLIWEITRGYPGTKSYFKEWLKVVGPGLVNVLNGYAFHIYWDHDMWDVIRDKRIKEIKQAIAELPAAQRKPIYVTEFGTRGEPDSNKAGLLWPGWAKKGCTAGRKGCRRILETTEAAVNNAFFQVAGARAGFRAFVYWDAYWTMYDKTEQHWSMISKPSDGLKRRPSFYAQKLFSHVVVPGWHAVSVSDPGRLHLRSTAFKDKNQLTVIGVNKSSCGTTFRYSGLPRSKMYVMVWNDNGDGRICSRGLQTTGGGTLNVPVHPRSVVALTTRSPGLNAPSCGLEPSDVDPPMCGDGECTEGETDASCGQDCGCGAGACGSVAPFGCYCDPTCQAEGDCCADLAVCQ